MTRHGNIFADVVCDERDGVDLLGRPLLFNADEEERMIEC